MNRKDKLIDNIFSPVLGSLFLNLLEKQEEQVREFSKKKNYSYRSITAAERNGTSLKSLTPICNKVLKESIYAALGQDISKSEDKVRETHLKHALEQMVQVI